METSSSLESGLGHSKTGLKNLREIRVGPTQTSIVNRRKSAIGGSSKNGTQMIVNNNRDFLNLYLPYINPPWRSHYLRYDALKEKYKSLKGRNGKNLLADFDSIFIDEIRRVDNFLEEKLEEISASVAALEEYSETHQEDDTNAVELKIMERTLRAAFKSCKDCEEFYKLNSYAIVKIAKKFEKLSHESDFATWPKYSSHSYFMEHYTPRLHNVHYLRDRCISAFSHLFRETFPELAVGELQYAKNHSGESYFTKIFLGIKVGFVFCVALWIAWAASVVGNGLDEFWVRPSLFVYTTLGNILLFRLTWIICITVWEQNFVNYSAAFEMNNQHPEIMILLNDLASLFVLYALNFLLYFWLNLPQGGISSPQWSSICPLFLIVFAIGYQLHQYLSIRTDKISYGLFNLEIVTKLMRAGFVDTPFRMVIAADICCSLTRFITDAARGTCWLVSGSFLQTEQLVTDFGSSYLNCTSPTSVTVISLLQLLPLIVRFLQCIRKNEKIQYLNAGKYASSMIAVIYGVAKGDTTLKSIIYTGYAINTAVVCYTWTWDCLMDWGLWSVNCADSNLSCGLSCTKSGGDICRNQYHSAGDEEDGEERATQQPPRPPISRALSAEDLTETNRYWGLRDVLMYTPPHLYYGAMLFDFLFRSLWVLSLSSVGTALLGSQLNFLLATCEIIRRCVWLCFRVEHEHLKNIKQHKVGFELTRAASMAAGGAYKLGPSLDTGSTTTPNGSVYGGNGSLPDSRRPSATAATIEMALVGGNTVTGVVEVEKEKEQQEKDEV